MRLAPALAGKLFLALVAAGVLIALRCGPVVKAPGFELRGISASGGNELAVTLSVSNPNRFTLEARDVDYQTLIDSNVCGTGHLAGPVRLAARDSAEVDFPLTVDVASLLRSLPAVLNDSVTVRVVGSYSAPVVFGMRRMKFDKQRRIALRYQLKSVLGKLFE